MPIRWDNIGSTAGLWNASNQASQAATNDVNQGFQALQGVLNNQQKVQDGNYDNQVSNNDIAFSQYMNDLQAGGVDAVEAARNNNEIANKISGFGGMLSDANQLRDGSQILTGARTAATAEYTYDQNLMKQELDPLVAQFKQLAFTDPNAARQFAGENEELFNRGSVDVAGIIRTQSTANQTFGDTQIERAARDPIYQIQQAIESGDIPGAQTIYDSNKSTLDAARYNFEGALTAGVTTQRGVDIDRIVSSAIGNNSDAQAVNIQNQYEKDSGLVEDGVFQGSKAQLKTYQAGLKEALQGVTTDQNAFESIRTQLRELGATPAEINAAETTYLNADKNENIQTTESKALQAKRLAVNDANFPQGASAERWPTNAEGQRETVANVVQSALDSNAATKDILADVGNEQQLDLFFSNGDGKKAKLYMQSLLSKGIQAENGQIYKVPPDMLNTLLTDLRMGSNWTTFQKGFTKSNLEESANRIVNDPSFQERIGNSKTYTAEKNRILNPASEAERGLAKSDAYVPMPLEEAQVNAFRNGIVGATNGASTTNTGQILTPQGAAAQLLALQNSTGTGPQSGAALDKRANQDALDRVVNPQSTVNSTPGERATLEQQLIDINGATAPANSRGQTSSNRAFNNSLAGRLRNGLSDFSGRAREGVNDNVRGAKDARLLRRTGEDIRKNGIENASTENLVNAMRNPGVNRPDIVAELQRRNAPTEAIAGSQTAPPQGPNDVEGRLMADLYSAQPQGNGQAAPQAQPAPAAITREQNPLIDQLYKTAMTPPVAPVSPASAPQAQITSPLIDELYQGAMTPSQLPPQNRPAAPAQAPSFTERAKNLGANIINSGVSATPIAGAALLTNAIRKENANVNRQKEATNKAASDVLSTVAQETRENTARTVNNLMSAAGQAQNGVAEIAQMAKKALPEMGIGLKEFDRLTKESKAKLDQSGVTSLTITEITSLLAQGTQVALKPYVKALRDELAKRYAEESQRSKADETFMEAQLRNLVTI